MLSVTLISPPPTFFILGNVFFFLQLDYAVSYKYRNFGSDYSQSDLWLRRKLDPDRELCKLQAVNICSTDISMKDEKDTANDP